MSALIPLAVATIGSETIQTVNGDLWISGIPRFYCAQN